MKKTIAALSLLAAAFLFIGCSKDKSSERNPLMGTKWAATVSWGALGLTFIDAKNATYTEITTGKGSRAYKAAYIYAEPNVRVEIEGDDQDFELSGEVSGTSMKLTLGNNGSIYDFKRID
jgi:hypothetical protein